MKKRVFGILLALVIVLALPAAAQAADGWKVTFTADSKMESNFTTSAIADAVAGLQPGDDAVFEITLENKYKDPVDWYMFNEVIRSLEDGTVASGGAYTYILTYRTSGGSVTELYNSDTVGGEGSENSLEGLHEASSALSDYFFLETMNPGGTGTVTLTVALDGESQGNRYQDTLANLTMKFAVEITPTQRVVTGDSTRQFPYYIALGVSGLAVLALALTGWKHRRKGEAA